MNESFLLWLNSGLLTGLFTLICWLGSRSAKSLDTLRDGLKQIQLEHKDELLEIYKQVQAGDNALHERVTTVCGRVSKLEAACEFQHGRI